MSENQFAFIIAVNNEQYYEECVYYINRLAVPEGFDIDVLAVREAESMCSAYNMAMQNSKAKYKIYLHQDVFIRNENFLYELLRIFGKDTSVGMIGMMGGTRMPRTGVAYLAWNIGLLDCRDADMSYILSGQPEVLEDKVVEAVDGLLIATQYDVPWREDLFQNFDFYDISESFEMRRKGYQVVVPFQKEPWVIHDSSFAKLARYDDNRKICLAEYPEYLWAEDGFQFEYQEEWETLSAQLAKQLKQLITCKNWETVRRIIAEYRKGNMKNSTLETIGIMSDIFQVSQQKAVTAKLYEKFDDYEQLYECYVEIRFLLRRMELGMPETSYQKIVELIKEEKMSVDMFMILVMHAVLDKKSVLEKLKEIYRKGGKTKEANSLNIFLEKIVNMQNAKVYTKRVRRTAEQENL